MDVHQKLDEIVAAVRGAKAMPMSASCVINRADLLARLDEVREALPGSLAEAQEVLGGREQVVADARVEAQRIVEAAHAERGSLVGGTEVVQQARAEAARLLAEARQEAGRVRAEADDYVDSKLANFEVVLGKTIASVDRGRDKLLSQQAPPEELLARADAYVDAQFGAIGAVLHKTLEAVGRGRRKLTGHRPSDELGEHLAAQDARTAQGGPQAPGYPAEGEYYAGYGVGAAPAGSGDPYGYQGGYERPADPYTSDEGYSYAAPASGATPYHGAALEETSLFDTGMIDAEQLRRYEQGG